MKKHLDKYKVLYNHDSTNAFCTDTPYQSSKEPFCVEQAQGLVDEVAEAGCDTLLISPTWGHIIPLWISDKVPLWQEKGKDLEFPDTFQGKVIHRIRDFLLAGNDFLGITEERCKTQGVNYFLSWRMFDVHGLEHADNPYLTDFYKNNPQMRTGDPVAPVWNSEISFDFKHPEVRVYMLGIIEELLERYDFNGVELDFMRFPTFFSRQVSYEARAKFMREFILGVRELLDRRGEERPICVRVPQRWDISLEVGLDLETWTQEGLVDLVNISPFYETSDEMDIELYREKLPKAKLFGEIHYCSTCIQDIELGLECTRKMTPEMLRTTAETFLSRGADGISLFNFVYYRDFSFGNPVKLDKFEPPFAALKDITNKEKLAEEPKHYLSAQQTRFYQGQFPLDLTNPGSRRLQALINISADFSSPDVRKPFVEMAILRLQFQDKVNDAEVTVRRLGRLLKPCRGEGELFPTQYIEGVPKDHSYTLDYELPLALLEKGENAFTFRLDKGERAIITRMEIAVYCKNGYTPVGVSTERHGEQP